MAEPGRELALALGELHGRLTEELTDYARLHKTERTKRAHEALAQLRSKEVVTEAETSQLETMLEAVRNVNMTDPQIADEVSTAYLVLQAANAGDVALALGSIAADSTRAEAERAVAEGRSEELGDGPIGRAALEGALVGTQVGAASGDPSFIPLATLVGAAAGAAAAAVQEALS
jgi:hypothetical protein